MDSKSGSSEIPTASSALLAGMKGMDADTWSRLVGIYGPVVYRWCRLSGVGEGDAADVVQEVFVTVARGANNFERRRDKGSFRSWLATITRSRVRDHHRRRLKEPEGKGGSDVARQLDGVEQSIGSTIDGESARASIARNVMSAVQVEFEPRTWQAFWMTAVEGLSGAEVAERTGMSVASVYQSKSRVLRRLRRQLEAMSGLE